MAAKLTKVEIKKRLAALPGWGFVNNTLSCSFIFIDFIEAFGFMTRVALVAQAMNHHPDWSNVYRTVHVRLSTHDAKGVTRKDFQLAKQIDRLAKAS